MNLAIAESQILKRKLPPQERSAKYQQILKSFDRASRVFKKHGARHYKSIYHMSIIDTLMGWLGHEIEESRKSLYVGCIPPGFSIPNSFELTGAELVQMLIRNPGVLGLLETPEWVPAWPDVIKDALGRVPTFGRRLKEAESFIERSSKSNHDLRIKVFELKSMLSQLTGLPEPPFDSFDSRWNAGLLEDYLTSALSFLMWERSDEYAENRYLTLLKRVLDCVIAIRSTWSAEDVERLLTRRTLAFRFSACELGRLGHWREGFLLLEATRGLVSSRSIADISLDSDEVDPISRNGSWVHVSHSPRAAYVFVFKDGNYFGKEFNGLGGWELTAEFLNLTRGGLLVDQDGDRTLAEASALRISKLLEPIADWVDEQCGNRIALLPGGYFQAFPFWACGHLGDSWLAGRKLISMAPSRAVAVRNAKKRSGPTASCSLSVQRASSVPGYNQLNWSEREADVITDGAPSHVNVSISDASRESLLMSLLSADAVHFTGHSSADIDPYESALITYGEPLSVRDILGASVSSSIVVLGSCQSALARNALRQDEMLSIQTAMFYSGCESVIGTSWPIRDAAGFAFTVKFYESLWHLMGSVDSLGVEVAIRACASALLWMRSVSVDELNSMFEHYGAPRVSGEPQEKAFGFYEWAAFGVVGVP
ncbi:CHAT domain-containing protein [Mycobacterium talmoniae]|uniref:CHAT domain-containing protein n=1 Tax=Mycobacterium talmoniae TaxID=1858794 RepID=UPI001A96FC1F|nr:CHAT domain-containing protein [Mycobacterium talmoniae]